jgi:hypothetical protein
MRLTTFSQRTKTREKEGKSKRFEDKAQDGQTRALEA